MLVKASQRKEKKKSKVSSIQAARKSIERLETLAVKATIDLPPRRGWFWCNTCDDSKGHYLWDSGYECVYCKKFTYYKGEPSNMPLLLML